MSKPNALDAMLNQYETNSSSYTNTPKKEYDLKNYFTTFLNDKEKSATRQIRILPSNDGTTPFKEIYGHKAQIDGEWKTFVCLKHEKNTACPFCEANDLLRATGKDTDKELAKKFNARKMYVVKVIDRAHEEDGIKFWRFNHDYRKQGIYDKIYGVLQAVKKDITDPTTGRDLLVFLARDQNNRPTVQTISHIDPEPLSTNPELAKKWLEDARTWEDVYSLKPYEYLEIVVKGGVPVWDKISKKFVDKSSISAEEAPQEISLGTPNVKGNIQTLTAPTHVAVIAGDDEEVDDLPF